VANSQWLMGANGQWQRQWQWPVASGQAAVATHQRRPAGQWWWQVVQVVVVVVAVAVGVGVG
jgi:hypothetical protein